MVKVDTKHKLNSALIGIILFDGTLSENRYLFFKHGSSKVNYVDEKVKFIEKYIKPKSVKLNIDKNGRKYKYAFFCSNKFNFLGRKIYKNGKKVLTKNILNRFDEITLAIMYLDCGCLSLRKGNFSNVYKSREIHLNVQKFSMNEVKMLKSFLFKKWNVDFKITLENEKPRLWCNTENTIKFLKLVSKVICGNFPSMYYKLDLKYKNKEINFLPKI